MRRTPSSQFSLAEAHTIGLRLVERMKHRGVYGDRELLGLAEEFGLTRHEAWEFRRFADPETGYTPKELRQLLRHCREHGYDMTLSIVGLLVRVPRRRRPEFERKLIRHGWGYKEARQQVRELVGKTGEGRGRRHAVPEDLKGRLLRIEQQCASFRRLQQEFAPHVPPGVRQQLRHAAAILADLQHGAERERARA